MDESADVSRRGLLRGVAGAAAVSTAAGTAAAQEETEGGEGEGEGDGGGGEEQPVFSSYVEGDANENSYENFRGQSEVTVEVGTGSDGLAFTPTKVWVDQGTEVTFQWVSNGHNVLPENQPEEAGWEGHEPLEDEGFTYSHTFETAGMYDYFCSPHVDLGMIGAVAVGDDVETESVSGGGGGGPDVPDAAKSLGIAAAFAMSATLGLAYFFMKYGGNYGEADTA